MRFLRHLRFTLCTMLLIRKKRCTEIFPKKMNKKKASISSSKYFSLPLETAVSESISMIVTTSLNSSRFCRSNSVNGLQFTR